MLEKFTFLPPFYGQSRLNHSAFWYYYNIFSLSFFFYSYIKNGPWHSWVKIKIAFVSVCDKFTTKFAIFLSFRHCNIPANMHINGWRIVCTAISAYIKRTISGSKVIWINASQQNHECYKDFLFSISNFVSNINAEA